MASTRDAELISQNPILKNSTTTTTTTTTTAKEKLVQTPLR